MATTKRTYVIAIGDRYWTGERFARMFETAPKHHETRAEINASLATIKASIGEVEYQIAPLDINID